MFGGKQGKVRFEVMGQREGRWTIEKVFGEELANLGREATERDIKAAESAATTFAKSLTSSGKFDAAKVVKESTGHFGRSSTEDIFSCQADKRAEEVLVAQPYHGPLPPFATVDDIVNRDAARVFGTVFRDYLKKQSVIWLEVAHGHGQFRRLDDTGGLMTGGINLIARRMSGDDSGAMKKNQDLLQDLMNKAIARARTAQADKQIPVFQGADPTAMIQAVAQRVEDKNERRYQVRVAIANRLLGAPGMLARMELALAGMAVTGDKDATQLLDEIAAGSLDMSDTIQDLLGQRRCLADAIVALANLAIGKLPPDDKAHPLAGLLSGYLAQKRMPYCADSLWDRIAGECAGKTPLDRHRPEREYDQIDRLTNFLPKVAPAGHAAAITFGMKTRMRRLEQQAMGN